MEDKIEDKMVEEQEELVYEDGKQTPGFCVQSFPEVEAKADTVTTAQTSASAEEQKADNWLNNLLGLSK